MQTFLVVAFPIAFFVLVGLSVFYVDARLRRLFPLPPKRLAVSALGAMVFGALLAAGIGATSASKLSGAGYLVGGHVFSLYLYTLLVLLATGVLAWLWNISKRIEQILLLTIPLGLTTVGAMQANAFVVTETDIALPKLKSAVSVMLISDVHLGHHRGEAYLAQIVDQANVIRPDIVLIAGDFIDANIAVSAVAVRPLGRLHAPVFYVGGNHEKEIDEGRVLALLAAQGVQVLHNQVVESHGLQLAGLDYMKADDRAFDLHPSADPRTIEKTLPGLALAAGRPTVLMHHSPVGVAYAAAAGVDLMVAGHTHGGQLFPATLFASMMFPFNHGLYQSGPLQLFVSKGAGTFLLKNRLGASNEINLLRLHPEQ